MSNTVEWQKRQNNHRYSRDDRFLAYKFQKEIESTVNKFFDDYKQKVLVVGTYNVKEEPWRLLGIADYRKLGLKLREIVVDQANPDIVEVRLIKPTRL